jgi:transcriptional regulator with XRE-family HTH domain
MANGNDNPAEVGTSALRTRRVAAGLSQEKLARLADCSSSMVKLIEHGYQPSDAMLGRLAGALAGATARSWVHERWRSANEIELRVVVRVHYLVAGRRPA